MDEIDLHHLHLILGSELGICGCGTPEDAYAQVRDLLAVMPLFQDGNGGKALEIVGSHGGLHLVLSMLDRARLIEHGGGIGGSWITDKGRWLLRMLTSAGDLEELDRAMGQGWLPEHECTDACWKERSDG